MGKEEETSGHDEDKKRPTRPLHEQHQAHASTESHKGSSNDFDILELVRARQSDVLHLAETLEHKSDHNPKTKEKAHQLQRDTTTRQGQPRTPIRRPRPEPAVEHAAAATPSREAKQGDGGSEEPLDMLKVVQARIQAQISSLEEPVFSSPECSPDPKYPLPANGVRPGAYEDAPGESPQRVDDLRFSLVGVVADAPRMEGSNNDIQLEDIEEGRASEDSSAISSIQYTQEEEDGVSISSLDESNGSNNSRRPRRNKRRISVAIEVDEEEENLPEAEHIDAESAKTMLSEQQKRERRFRMSTLFLMLLLLAAFAGLILFVLWITGRLDASDNNTPHFTHTPTPAPKLPRDQHVRSFLPNETLQAIDTLPRSPQARAFFWMTHHPTLYRLPHWRIQQLFAMVTLFYSTHGIKWENKQNWLTYRHHECKWYSSNGTSCQHNTDGMIDTLHLENNGLQFELPLEVYLLNNLQTVNLRENELTGVAVSSHIGALSHLSALSMSKNNFSASLPTQIGLLNNLKVFDFADNYHISGSIPSEIGMLTKLQALHGYYNSLNGTLPTQLGLLSNLVEFDLGENYLEGTIPTELGNWKKMVDFLVSFNNLSGQIPSELGNWRELHRFNADENWLDGTLPTEMGQWTNIDDLQLYNNTIFGTIPSEIGLLTNLRIWYMDYNFLWGEIPTELGLLSTKLYSAYLGYNLLSGTIPSELGQWETVTFFYLAANLQLGGSIPSELGLMKDCFTMDLRAMDLSGPVPSELGSIQNLHDLALDSNRLTSTIPSELWKLKKLQLLYLGNNQLSGTIPPPPKGLPVDALHLNGNLLTGGVPSELGHLSEVKRLTLQDNYLNGSLPSEFGFCTALEALRLDHNAWLAGPIPEEIGDLVGLREFNIARTGISGEIPSDLCNIDPSFDCSPILCGCECACKANRGGDNGVE